MLGNNGQENFVWSVGIGLQRLTRDRKVAGSNDDAAVVSCAGDVIAIVMV